jgi:hypothetical protein
MRTDGQTDRGIGMRQLIVTFRNFANTPKDNFGVPSQLCRGKFNDVSTFKMFTRPRKICVAGKMLLTSYGLSGHNKQ